ncbi:MAG: hypothetical protein QOJ59_5220 [Thermomicrobiales bacterium]|nr:hypothetical protein [Thermomicrobiales bacterium]
MRDWSVPALIPRHAPIPHSTVPAPNAVCVSSSSLVAPPFAVLFGRTDRALEQTTEETPNGPGLYALGHREWALGPTEALQSMRRAGGVGGQRLARFVRRCLLPETETSDRDAIPIHVLTAQVGKQSAPSTDHLQQPAPRVVVVPVCPQMIGQSVDALGQQRDLDLGRTGVGLVHPKVADDGLFLNLFQRHAGGASFAGAPYNPWAARDGQIYDQRV